ncbi:TIGR03643 family protein [Flavobacteriaceae bacterium TP-CH-4]|uniref:TIGR03643 family protein n=1 Tax=Pelagihabitans pacificus TaxID=2696054 RepID=A0A967AXD1_9FLAO|nr:TIGR03643 family protein [Pelagihabitans pacificus]NHF61055.1 TIGR03643 family protein [Pelagihabitans pacificus]
MANVQPKVLATQYDNKLTEPQIDRIIEMAWEDRTPFEAIEYQFGLPEKEVIRLMRSQLKSSSFKLWRKRVNSGVSHKHLKKRNPGIDRFKCTRQRSISGNKISKR